MGTNKSGALTFEELFEIWKSSVDKNYREPLIEAGEGNGLEAFTQMIAQMQRVSEAIDRTTQGMFILPWSGQTNPPASGPEKALVTLTFTRSKLTSHPLILGEGLVFVGEQVTDWGVNAGVTVLTGRRYTLTEDLVFAPGEAGPKDVVCIAEFEGYGYNNPLPRTIIDINQVGSRFFHDRATITTVGPLAPSPTQTPASVTVTTVNEADMFVPEHVGQYVQFTLGANTGKIARIVSFNAPVPPLLGSAVNLELTQAFESFTFAGTFQVGELVAFDSGGPVLGWGRVLEENIPGANKRVVFDLLSGTVGTNATGDASGATATVDVMLADQLFTPESGAASWRILDWGNDWGLTAFNELSPVGGKLGMLDELGAERGLPRSVGETDEAYRRRVAEIADVVTPNAIRRALQRVMGAFPYCFREVGSPLLPGFFYDGDGAPASAVPHSSPNDAYDYDCIVFNGVITSGTFQFQEPVVLETADMLTVKAVGWFGRIDAGITFTMIRKEGKGAFGGTLRIRGLVSGAIFTPSGLASIAASTARRFHTYLDYADFRAFFLVGVPPISLGEFGFAYDVGAANAWDTGFADGYPALAGEFYRRVYDAVNSVKAGGVGFSMYVETLPCV